MSSGVGIGPPEPSGSPVTLQSDVTTLRDVTGSGRAPAVIGR